MATCTYFAYSVPVGMTEYELAALIDRELREMSIPPGISKITMQMNEALVEFKQPVLLTKEIFMCEDQQVHLMPEVVRTCTLTVNRRWTDKLHWQHLKTLLPTGVKINETRDELVLESSKPEDLCTAVGAIKQSVVDQLVCSDQSIQAQATGPDDPAHEDECGKLSKETGANYPKKDILVEQDQAGIEPAGENSEKRSPDDVECNQCSRRRDVMVGEEKPPSVTDGKRNRSNDGSGKSPKSQRKADGNTTESEHASGGQPEQRVRPARDVVGPRASAEGTGSESNRSQEEISSVKAEQETAYDEAAHATARDAHTELRENSHPVADKEQQNHCQGAGKADHVSPVSDQRTDKYVIDEPLWAYIKLVDPQSKWGTKFTAFFDPKHGTEMMELTGSGADIDSLKTFCDAHRLRRAITREMCPVPKQSQMSVFFTDVQKLADGKVLVRQVDGTYCELVGKKSDVDELRRKVCSIYPDFSDAGDLDKQPVVTATPEQASAARSTWSSGLAGTKPNSGNEFEFRTPSSILKVKVVTGDLLRQRCEILVNPTNAFLAHTSGLSKLLADAAGYQMQRECEQHLRKFQVLPAAQVLDTTAGRMSKPVRRIFHACGPIMRETPDSNMCGQLLEQTFFNCFQIANDRQHARSIAVPAISSGAGRVPCQIVALAAWNALRRFDTYLQTSPNKFLTDVNFVNIQDEITMCMISIFKQQLLQLSSSPSAAGVKDMAFVSTGSDYSEVQLFDYTKLRDVATRKGLSIVDVPMDGDCALHAVLRQLQQLESCSYDAASLRKCAVDYLRSHVDLVNAEMLRKCYDGDVREYLNVLSERRTVCDDCMIHAIAGLTRRRIQLYDDDGAFTAFEPSSHYPGKSIILGRIARAHYVSLEPSGSLGETRKPHEPSTADEGLRRNELDAKRSYNQLRTEAAKRGYRVVDVPRTADSALHAVVHQLRRQDIRLFDESTLRRRAVDYLQSHKHLIGNDLSKVQSYLSALTTPGTRCDEVMLTAVAEVIHKEIHVLHDDGHLHKLGLQLLNVKPVIVGAYGKDWYVSLENSDSRTSAEDAVSEPASQCTDVASRPQNHVQNASFSTNSGPDKPVSSTSDSCPICMDVIKNAKTLSCNHTFCSECVDQSLAYQPKCPCCGKLFGVLRGDQPEGGSMHVNHDRWLDVQGYPGCGRIVIDYFIPDGQQKENHPNPGKRFTGARRTAYLPGNAEGKEICQLLRRAFDARLVFTVGRSTTSGREDVVTWNDIHHKTNLTGQFGYPDSSYLSRVKEELAAKGITSDQPPPPPSSSSSTKSTATTGSARSASTFAASHVSSSASAVAFPTASHVTSTTPTRVTATNHDTAFRHVTTATNPMSLYPVPSGLSGSPSNAPVNSTSTYTAAFGGQSSSSSASNLRASASGNTSPYDMHGYSTSV